MSARRLPLLVALVLISGFGAAFVTPDCAYACSCASPAGSSPKELARREFSGSDAVFAGEVTDIDKPRLITSSLDPMTVTFRVSEAWKGTERGTVNVETAIEEASCGYPFNEGESYLVYASKGTSSGGLEVALCSSTKPLSEADADLAALGPGAAPTGSPPGGDRLPDTSGVRPGLPDPAWALLFASGAAVLVVAAACARSWRWRRPRR